MEGLNNEAVYCVQALPSIANRLIPLESYHEYNNILCIYILPRYIF